MVSQTWEILADHLLHGTKEWADITQLEHMTWLSRKMINILDKFNRPHQDSPDAASIMEYLKKETGITDEKIILSNIINILKNRRNDTVVWEYWIEKKTLVTMEIYNYCTTIINWYEKLIEEITNVQEDVSKTLEPTAPKETQLEIDFPEE